MAARSKPKEGEQSMEERYPRTIAQQLFDSWQILRRYGDPGRICKAAKISRPIVDRAINYGHVKDPNVTKAINKFFSDRTEKENNTGGKFIAGAKKG